MEWGVELTEDVPGSVPLVTRRLDVFFLVDLRGQVRLRGLRMNKGLIP